MDNIIKLNTNQQEPTTTSCDEANDLISIADELLFDVRSELPQGRKLSVPMAQLSALGAGVASLLPTLKIASQTHLKGILGYSELPLVSVDYKQSPESTIIDGLSTMVMDNNMVKIVAWYDNEWGYSCRTLDLVNYVAKEMILVNRVTA
jgi:hypothetical protein